jgi:hypothetical protein
MGATFALNVGVWARTGAAVAVNSRPVAAQTNLVMWSLGHFVIWIFGVASD